jgi:hypothetical protein
MDDKEKSTRIDSMKTRRGKGATQTRPTTEIGDEFPTLPVITRSDNTKVKTVINRPKKPRTEKKSKGTSSDNRITRRSRNGETEHAPPIQLQTQQ